MDMGYKNSVNVRTQPQQLAILKEYTVNNICEVFPSLSAIAVPKHPASGGVFTGLEVVSLMFPV